MARGLEVEQRAVENAELRLRAPNKNTQIGSIAAPRASRLGKLIKHRGKYFECLRVASLLKEQVPASLADGT